MYYSTGISLPAGTVSVAGARPQYAESQEAPAGAHPAASASGLRSAPGPPSIAAMSCELARLVNASAQHHAVHARAGGGDCEAAKASAPGAKGASAQALRRHHTPLSAPLLHHKCSKHCRAACKMIIADTYNISRTDQESSRRLTTMVCHLTAGVAGA